ncbi:MAG: tagaturonate reductase [Treponema sp.]|jgi:mannitol-1-phosphate/altronate dehydrogenase|nr:tagaturonate reductase [Treponema sp.]
MKTIDQVLQTKSRPERVLQYGEGNFLRAFADWQIDILNEKTDFNGNAAVVQPRNREGSMGAVINAQRGLYTTVLRGLENGRAVEEFRAVRSLSRCINPYTQFDEYIACAENPDLRFVFSNTTEAGIAYSPEDRLEDQPQRSFPGKAAAFLNRRYRYFRGDPARALVFLPCELIDRNGDTLRGLVERYAAEWKLGEGFIRWLESCVFCNTLVDRIVSGFPGEEAEALWERLGYRDDLLSAGELFHLWVIEQPAAWDGRKELPLEEAGLKVIRTDNLEFYRTRKVRILNGAHSAAALAAYLYGLDTVGAAAADPLVYRFMRRAIFDEIIPSLDPGASLDASALEGLKHFAGETLERFANPFVHHQLLSISLNSTAKFKTRVLPSILAYRKRYGKAPPALCCSLAALMAFYRGRNPAGGEMEGRRAGKPYVIRDDEAVLRHFAALWAALEAAMAAGRPAAPIDDGDSPALGELVRTVLSREDWWGEDLNAYPDIRGAVQESLGIILRAGMGRALEQAAGDGL